MSVIGDSSRVGECGPAIVVAARADVAVLMKSLARELGRSGTTANDLARLGRERARPRLGRGQPREADQALPASPPGQAERRGADGGIACVAARRLDHRTGVERQGRFQHGLTARRRIRSMKERKNDAAH